MANKNTSDSIEAYIKALLAQAVMAELKEVGLADVFQVVLVRLTMSLRPALPRAEAILERTSAVVGAISIGKVQFSDHHQMLLKRRTKT